MEQGACLAGLSRKGGALGLGDQDLVRILGPTGNGVMYIYIDKSKAADAYRACNCNTRFQVDRYTKWIFLAFDVHETKDTL